VSGDLTGSVLPTTRFRGSTDWVYWTPWRCSVSGSGVIFTGARPGDFSVPRSLVREYDRLLVPFIALTMAFLGRNAIQWSEI